MWVAGQASPSHSFLIQVPGMSQNNILWGYQSTTGWVHGKGRLTFPQARIGHTGSPVVGERGDPTACACWAARRAPQAPCGPWHREPREWNMNGRQSHREGLRETMKERKKVYSLELIKSLFKLLFKQRTLHFHFALSLLNHAVSLACAGSDPSACGASPPPLFPAYAPLSQPGALAGQGACQAPSCHLAPILLFPLLGTLSPDLSVVTSSCWFFPQMSPPDPNTKWLPPFCSPHENATHC